MAQASVDPRLLAPRKAGRGKFLVGGLLIIGAIIFLIATTLQSTAQYFYTVDEVRARGSEVFGRSLRVSGAVLGDTITYDRETQLVTFDMVHVTNDNREIAAAGGLAEALYQAVNLPNAARITVVYNNVMPDLLKHEAQAIVTGRLDENGVFHADELLLKCPTRYEEAVPAQAEG